MSLKPYEHHPHEYPQHHDQAALKNLKVSRIFLPILLGISVVIWMMYKQLDLEEFSRIQVTGHVVFWLGMAVFMYVLRHIFYAWRLRIMTEYAFSWSKAIELIFIWEFSSAVSPTSVGGAGVAFFLLSQERLSGARTISVVLYSMVIDTLYFVITLPLLYMILGPIMIRPDMFSFSDIDGYGITFLTVLLFMTAYGMVFYYGLFVNPRSIKRLLIIISRWSILKKFRQDLRTTAYDVMTTSKNIKNQSWSFHARAFSTTFGAWTTRFFAINCLIMALVSGIDPSVYEHMIMIARGEAMHVITSFSPTPGAAGVAEYLFGGFFRDYIPAGIAVLIALIWRIISFYTYLTAGAVIIPVWFRKIQLRRKEESLKQHVHLAEEKFKNPDQN